MAFIHVRLNDETDQDIIAWLDSQDNKTAAVKDAIRFAMTDAPNDEPAAVDLCAIRAVFETVLDERLAGLVLGQDDGDPEGEDPEAAAKLDAMF